MDGTISLKEVWKVEEFHPGRNYRCVDGAFSQKQLGRFPSFKKLINIQCIGEKEVGDYWMSDGTEGGYNFKKGLKYGELVGPQEHRYVGMSVRPVFGGMPSYAPSVSYLHYKAPPMKKIVFNWYGRTK